VKSEQVFGLVEDEQRRGSECETNDDAMRHESGKVAEAEERDAELDGSYEAGESDSRLNTLTLGNKYKSTQQSDGNRVCRTVNELP
jgi:hypothetical protein